MQTMPSALLPGWHLTVADDALGQVINSKEHSSTDFSWPRQSSLAESELVTGGECALSATAPTNKHTHTHNQILDSHIIAKCY